MWTWLTEPLPLDVANTRRWADDSQAEYLDDTADLEAWLNVVRPRLPRNQFDLPESLDGHDLSNFRELRDLLIAIFSALSAGQGPPLAALDQLAQARLSYPVLQVLDEIGPVWAAPEGQPPEKNLLGLIAAESVELIRSAPDLIAVCHAPSCHWLYLQGRPNQRWCHPDCGNRARVNRHKHRNTAVEAQVVDPRGEHVN